MTGEEIMLHTTNLKRILIFGAITLFVLAMMFCSTTNVHAENEDDVFDVEISSGAEYDGYIVRLKENVTISEEDTTLSTICTSKGLYKASSISQIEASIDADNIEYIEPDYIVYADEDVNDTYYSLQWGLDATNADAIFSSSLSADGVVIGVIDSGLYTSHEDIDALNVVTGYNFLDENTDTTDTRGHGTKVTSVIAATTNNNKGVASLGYGATIVPLKVFGSEGSTPTSKVVSAIYAAVDDYDCDVINMSLSSDEYSDTKAAACQYAYNNGVILIAAAGNDNSSALRYPAAFDTVIGVAAIKSDGTRPIYTYNSSVFITAPGVSIYTTQNTSSSAYGYSSGTSFSSPYIASLAALARGYDDDISFEDFKGLLKLSAIDKGTSGYDVYYGWGLIDCSLFTDYLITTLPFTDVTFSNWSYPYVSFCYENGLINGTSATTFTPYGNITRADFVTLLGRLYEADGGTIPNNTTNYTDVPAGMYFTKYIAWATENGLVSGYGNGLFGTYDPITREQLAVILYRYAVFSGESIGTVNTSVLNVFTDKSSINSWATTAMAWAVQNEIMTGTSATTISPWANALREQTATVFYRYCGLYNIL